MIQNSICRTELARNESETVGKKLVSTAPMLLDEAMLNQVAGGMAARTNGPGGSWGSAAVVNGPGGSWGSAAVINGPGGSW